MSYASRKYDVKYVLLDHLHFFINRQSENETRDISEFMFNIVALGRKLNVNIWLVAHPAKLDNQKGKVCMNDIKGSSSIKQDAHNVITIRRDKEKEKEGDNEVIIDFEKVRHISGKGGKKRYIFNPVTLKYIAKLLEEDEHNRSKGRGMSSVRESGFDKACGND